VTGWLQRRRERRDAAAHAAAADELRALIEAAVTQELAMITDEIAREATARGELVDEALLRAELERRAPDLDQRIREIAEREAEIAADEAVRDVVEELGHNRYVPDDTRLDRPRTLRQRVLWRWYRVKRRAGW
jgi:hypothetical protein